MFIPVERSNDKETNYKRLLDTLPYYLNQSDSWVTTLSNTSAMLNYFLDEINWVGFYTFDGEKLRLGPFQGLPACTEIAIGNGVCGKAALLKQTVRIDDVNSFEGHIACDSASESEIVIPLMVDNKLFAVLDIDAPFQARFDMVDQENLEKVVAILVDFLK